MQPAEVNPLSDDHIVFLGSRPAPGAPEVQPRPTPQPPRRRAAGAGPAELSKEDARFLAKVCEEGGLDIGRYRAAVLQRRRAACVRALRTGSIDEAFARVAGSRANAEQALSSLMIGVTGFFRDSDIFEELGKRLPALHENRSGLRVLSIGCSDGSELYSIGMLLDEGGMLGSSTLIGIDCRQDALRVAADGVYPASALAGLGAARLKLHFESSGAGGGHARVRGDLRAACRWVLEDAFRIDPGLRADVVLCRNLAIYLRPEAAGELWASLAGRLEPGGLLVVGKAERPRFGMKEDDDPALEVGASRRLSSLLVRVAPCIYRRSEEDECRQ